VLVDFGVENNRRDFNHLQSNQIPNIQQFFGQYGEWCAFDYLIGSKDRHKGNYLYDIGENWVYSVDNEERPYDAQGQFGPFDFAVNNSFGISGNASAPFYPGAAPQPLNLVLANPYNFDIKVTGITVTIQTATTKNGNPNPACNGSQNLKVTQQFNGTVTLAKKTTSSLSQLGTPASQYPLLQMPDLPVNQDACQNSTFRMSYSGTAVKP